PATDKLELGIAVGVRTALAGLAVDLEAVAEVVQQGGNGRMTDRVALLLQGLGQLPRAFARPAQRRHGIAACDRIDQLFQIVEQGSIVNFLQVTTTPRATAAL